MSEESQERGPYETGKSDERPETGGVGFASRATNVPTTAPMTRLASRVLTEFQTNAEHRRMSGVDTMLENAAMAAKLRYSPKQKEVFAALGIDPRNYRPLTLMKMRTARALLVDIVKQSGDKPYVLSPTPVPDIPDSAKREIMQSIAQEVAQFFERAGGQFADERQAAAFYVAVIQRVAAMYDDVKRREEEWAKERCARMDRKIHDQLVEGGFIDAFNALIGYICTYGTGVMVGPCPRVVATQRVKEVMTAAGPVPKYVREYAVKPVYEAVSPWDCFPAPNAKSVRDGTLCIKVRYTPNVLHQYAEAMEGKRDAPDGWQVQTVRALLSQYPNGGVRLEADAYDLVRRDMERNTAYGDRDCTLEGIRCFGSFRGSDLISCGITRTPDGEKVVYNRYYKTETIVIANYVVFCRVIDDRMILPVAKATLYESPDCWWGDSLADILYSAQSMHNNALKNYIVNDAISSNGMFVCSDVNNAVSLDGSPVLSVRAGKMFGFKRPANGGNGGVPISVLQVPDKTEKFFAAMEKAAKLAEDDSGIREYSIGSQNVSGAGRTASGFAMMLESGMRVTNMTICDLGRNVIVPVVKNTHDYNLLYDDDVSIKGDVEVNPSGLMGKILREAESQRRQQVTAMLGQHPVYSKAIPVEGFFELIRPELENIGVNVDRIIPSKERMALIQELLDAAQAAAVANGQAQAEAAQAAAAEPTPEQANVARVEGQPEEVAMEQGAPNAGTVEERRGAA